MSGVVRFDSYHPHEKQRALRTLSAGPARYILAYGGSRSGKTLQFCVQIIIRAIRAPGSKHLIYRKTQSSVKASIGSATGTMPDALRLKAAEIPVRYNKSEGIFTFPNGSEVWLAGLDSHNIDKVLGNEFATVYGNELSEIPFTSHETLESRLAQVVACESGQALPQRFYGDLNPTTRAHWTYRMWQDLIHPVTGDSLDPEMFASIQINPADNAENLDPAYLAALQRLGERARKRFWDGTYSADADAALWRRAMIRRTKRDIRDLKRIVVAVDPAVTDNPGSNETGIIAAGLDDDGIAYVLADDSGHMPAAEWGRRAIALHDELGADRIVAETNNGGDLVVNQILAMAKPGRPPPRVRKVTATRGKHIRAEPVAGLYERGKVYHAGEFSDLEDQMCSFTIDFDRKAEGTSPDRMDALVWAITDLFGDLTRAKPAASEEPARRPVPRNHGWMR